MTGIIKQDRKYVLWGLLAWLGLNIVQAYFLDITPDEAYYFMYAQHLDWGYFDHPPIVAVLIKMGYTIIPNVLGVRLWFILLGTVSIYLLWRIVQPKNLTLFGLIIGATGLIHVAAFQALPDIPLIFFTVVYLFLIQQYLKQPHWKWAIPIGLTITLLLLSKYHGFLVLIFTIIAYPKFVLKRDFWLIFGVATICLLPHFFWQLNHDFPSLNYHLSDRNIKPYTYAYIAQYWLGQPIVLGPLVSFWLLFGAWKIQTTDTFDKILKTLLWGTLLFFGLSTLRAYVLPHWTAIALIPLLILGIRYFEEHLKTYLRTLKIVCWVSIVIISIGRIFAVYDFVPQSLIKHDHLHHWQTWANQIQEIAQEQPVTFVNSYEAAAKYNFYTQKVGFSLNNVAYRRNQYDFLQEDLKLLGNRVLFLSDSPVPNCDTLHTVVDKTYYFRWIDNFVSYPRIRITSPKKTFISPSENTALTIPIAVVSPYTIEQLNLNTNYPSTLSYHWYKNGNLYTEQTTDIKISDIQNSAVEYDFTIQSPQEKGQYHLKVGVATGWLPPLHSSDIFKITIE